jgi:hypothetical protein
MRHLIRALALTVAGVALVAPRPGLADEAGEVSARYLGNITHFQGVEERGVDVRVPARLPFELPDRVAFDWVVSAGTLRDRAETTGFAGAGGVATLQVTRALRGIDLQFGVIPVWTEADWLNDRDFGGHLHFTLASALRVHLDPEQRLALALLAQHSSNAGLDEANPGLDLAGLEVSWRFDPP